MNIPGKGKVVLIINQHDLSGQMAALSLIDLKMQFLKLEIANGRKGGVQLPGLIPEASDLIRIHSLVGSKDLTDVDVGFVKGVLFPVSILPGKFPLQAVRRSRAADDFIKQGQQPAMIHIGMGDKDGLVHPIKCGNEPPEELKHFIPVTGITAVDKQHLLITSDYDRVAAAGRLDQKDLAPLCHLMGADPGNESLTP